MTKYDVRALHGVSDYTNTTTPETRDTTTPATRGSPETRGEATERPAGDDASAAAIDRTTTELSSGVCRAELCFVEVSYNNCLLQIGSDCVDVGHCAAVIGCIAVIG